MSTDEMDIEKKTNYLIMLTIILIVALFTIKLSYFKEEVVNRTDINAVPLTINTWVGKDVPIDEQTYEILETRNVLLREYRNQSAVSENQVPVYLSIVFSESNRRASHPPEICYEAGGFSIMGKAAESVQASGDSIKANKIVIQKGGVKQLVLYWYVAGTKYTTNYYRQQLSIVSSQILGKDSQAALVRFSTPVIDDDETEALKRLKKFIKETNPVISEYL